MSNTVFTYIDNSTSSVSTAIINNASYNASPALKSVSIGTTATSIAANTFFNLTSLISVTFDSTSNVTTIGNVAFSSCPLLTSIILPNSVTSIGNSCFQVITGSPGLTSITLPTNVLFTSLPQGCFQACAALTSITIPSSVTSIGGNCFNGCNGFTTFTIPNTVLTLGNSCFQNCIGLTSITLSTSLTTLPQLCFSGCTAFTTFTILNNITTLGIQCFQGSTGLTSISIGTGITSLPAQCFQNCSGFITFNIPNTITTLGTSCFQNCTGLTSITIPSSITSLPISCFQGCTGFTSFVVPNFITSLGTSCFSGCNKIVTMTIGNSVASIGDTCFLNCTLLAFFIFNNQNALTSIGGTFIFFGDNPMRVTYYGISSVAGLNATSLSLKTQFPVGSTFFFQLNFCFREDSLILSFIDEKEQYVPINSLKNGMLVKTFKHGYKQIFGISKSIITDSDNKDYKLYKCTNEHYPEIFQDLYITGNHSILVSKITEKQREDCVKAMGRFCVTDGKGRLMAHLDNRAIPHSFTGTCNIFHLALEHECIDSNYGIYANGLLVETTSKRLINQF